jgi:acid phosphatase type 7
MRTRTIVIALSTFVALGSQVVHADTAPPVVAAAGDVACDPRDPGFGLPNGPGASYCRMGATAALMGDRVDRILALGDLQYENGDLAKFQSSYDRTWGAFKDITEPVVGNHEYRTPGAQGYFGYFGARAHPYRNGYYSYNLGGWHLVAINSNCKELDGPGGHGCAEGSPQEQWLVQDLADDTSRCTLAYSHHPRFSSDAPTQSLGALVSDLYDDGAELLISGHAHNYERFAPQTPGGAVDEANGIVQIVVGTGGKNHRPFDLDPLHSVVRNDNTFGVFKLTLNPRGYNFRFQSVDGSFLDTGSVSCH